jgi:glycosyltransferase involved in cell wall biosynthesis
MAIRPATSTPVRVYLDLTHLGRHVTGIERVSIEQFEKVAFDGAEIVPVRSTGVASMVLRQQFFMPLLALRHPRALFVFPGFPPSPLFSLIRERVYMYVHDTFLITRTADLSTKARLYMAPQFRVAVGRLKNFVVNSEKTRADLAVHTACDAIITLYRPSVANHFGLEAGSRSLRLDAPRPLRLVSLGTVEPRKNYGAALAIVDCLAKKLEGGVELHIIGRTGWGDDAARISAHPAVTVHGYLESADVKRVIENADVYLCTSHDEGLGLPLLEAQFAGLPVVAPDQPVFREVLGASGTLIDTAAPDQASDAILSLISKSGWRAAHATAATTNVAAWNARAAHDFTAAKLMFATGDRAGERPRPMTVRSP